MAFEYVANGKQVRLPVSHDKIAVRFKDAELLCGYSLSYSPERVGFFLFPADPGSNNMRVYVMIFAVSEIQVGPAAEQLAKRFLPGRDAA